MSIFIKTRALFLAGQGVSSSGDKTTSSITSQNLPPHRQEQTYRWLAFSFFSHEPQSPLKGIVQGRSTSEKQAFLKSLYEFKKIIPSELKEQDFLIIQNALSESLLLYPQKKSRAWTLRFRMRQRLSQWKFSKERIKKTNDASREKLGRIFLTILADLPKNNPHYLALDGLQKLWKQSQKPRMALKSSPRKQQSPETGTQETLEPPPKAKALTREKILRDWRVQISSIRRLIPRQIHLEDFLIIQTAFQELLDRFPEKQGALWMTRRDASRRLSRWKFSEDQIKQPSHVERKFLAILWVMLEIELPEDSPNRKSLNALQEDWKEKSKKASLQSSFLERAVEFQKQVQALKPAKRIQAIPIQLVRSSASHFPASSPRTPLEALPPSSELDLDQLSIRSQRLSELRKIIPRNLSQKEYQLIRLALREAIRPLPGESPRIWRALVSLERRLSKWEFSETGTKNMAPGERGWMAKALLTIEERLPKLSPFRVMTDQLQKRWADGQESKTIIRKPQRSIRKAGLLSPLSNPSQVTRLSILEDPSKLRQILPKELNVEEFLILAGAFQQAIQNPSSKKAESIRWKLGERLLHWEFPSSEKKKMTEFEKDYLTELILFLGKELTKHQQYFFILKALLGRWIADEKASLQPIPVKILPTKKGTRPVDDKARRFAELRSLVPRTIHHEDYELIKSILESIRTTRLSTNLKDMLYKFSRWEFSQTETKSLSYGEHLFLIQVLSTIERELSENHPHRIAIQTLYARFKTGALEEKINRAIRLSELRALIPRTIRHEDYGVIKAALQEIKEQGASALFRNKFDKFRKWKFPKSGIKKINVQERLFLARLFLMIECELPESSSHRLAIQDLYSRFQSQKNEAASQKIQQRKRLSELRSFAPETVSVQDYWRIREALQQVKIKKNTQVLRELIDQFSQWEFSAVSTETRDVSPGDRFLLARVFLMIENELPEDNSYRLSVQALYSNEKVKKPAVLEVQKIEGEINSNNSEEKNQRLEDFGSFIPRTIRFQDYSSILKALEKIKDKKATQVLRELIDQFSQWEFSNSGTKDTSSKERALLARVLLAIDLELAHEDPDRLAVRELHAHLKAQKESEAKRESEKVAGLLETWRFPADLSFRTIGELLTLILKIKTVLPVLNLMVGELRFDVYLRFLNLWQNLNAPDHRWTDLDPVDQKAILEVQQRTHAFLSEILFIVYAASQSDYFKKGRDPRNENFAYSQLILKVLRDWGVLDPSPKPAPAILSPVLEGSSEEEEEIEDIMSAIRSQKGEPPFKRVLKATEFDEEGQPIRDQIIIEEIVPAKIGPSEIHSISGTAQLSQSEITNKARAVHDTESLYDFLNHYALYLKQNDFDSKITPELLEAQLEKNPELFAKLLNQDLKDKVLEIEQAREMSLHTKSVKSAHPRHSPKRGH